MRHGEGVHRRGAASSDGGAVASLRQHRQGGQPRHAAVHRGGAVQVHRQDQHQRVQAGNSHDWRPGRRSCAKLPRKGQCSAGDEAHFRPLSDIARRPD